MEVGNDDLDASGDEEQPLDGSHTQSTSTVRNIKSHVRTSEDYKQKNLFVVATHNAIDKRDTLLNSSEQTDSHKQKTSNADLRQLIL